MQVAVKTEQFERDDEAGLGQVECMVIAQRHAQLEAEIAAGQRDARSLVALPADLVKRAELAFPEEPFGPPKPW